MPAWTQSAGERLIGCKVVSVYPDNAKPNKPSVYGNYLLMSGETGETLALIDGTALTAWRTAAASALAARYLAREDAEHLVMVGAGALSAASHPRAQRGAADQARDAVEPHPLARRLHRVRAARRRHRAADRRRSRSRGAQPPTSCPAPRCRAEPLIRGAWLKKGAHVDLVGAFTPKMREADDDAVRRARIYVDVRASAPKGSGDIAIPLKSKIIKPATTSRATCSSCAAARRRAASARTRSRCSSRSAPRSRIWRRRCWCGRRLN